MTKLKLSELIFPNVDGVEALELYVTLSGKTIITDKVDLVDLINHIKFVGKRMQETGELPSPTDLLFCSFLVAHEKITGINLIKVNLEE